MVVKLARVEEDTLRDDIPLNSIFLDVSYGRVPNSRHVQSIAADWDDEKVGVIYLSLRDDGRFACLDGWHRVEAARIAKVPSIPARVYIDLTVAEEATLYTAFNRDRRKLQAIEIYRSRLAAGEPRARAIQTVLSSLGLSLNTNPNDGHVQAVQAVEAIYAMGAETLLSDVLSILLQAWGRSYKSFNGRALYGTAHFLIRFPDADRSRTISVLQGTTPRGMVTKALTYSEVYHHDSRATGWGRALHGAYNFKLRSGALSEWPQVAYSPAGLESVRETRRRKKLIPA